MTKEIDGHLITRAVGPAPMMMSGACPDQEGNERVNNNKQAEVASRIGHHGGANRQLARPLPLPLALILLRCHLLPLSKI